MSSAASLKQDIGRSPSQDPNYVDYTLHMVHTDESDDDSKSNEEIKHVPSPFIVDWVKQHNKDAKEELKKWESLLSVNSEKSTFAIGIPKEIYDILKMAENLTDNTQRVAFNTVKSCSFRSGYRAKELQIDRKTVKYYATYTGEVSLPLVITDAMLFCSMLMAMSNISHLIEDVPLALTNVFEYFRNNGLSPFFTTVDLSEFSPARKELNTDKIQLGFSFVEGFIQSVMYHRTIPHDTDHTEENKYLDAIRNFILALLKAKTHLDICQFIPVDIENPEHTPFEPALLTISPQTDDGSAGMTAATVFPLGQFTKQFHRQVVTMGPLLSKTIWRIFDEEVSKMTVHKTLVNKILKHFPRDESIDLILENIYGFWEILDQRKAWESYKSEIMKLNLNVKNLRSRHNFGQLTYNFEQLKIIQGIFGRDGR
jgi:hypothetical protein